MPEDSRGGCLVNSRNHIMEEDKKIQEVLDQFMDSHEQTYEEFLGTFTHLSKGENNFPSRPSDSVALENNGPAPLSSHESLVPELRGISSGSNISSTVQPLDDYQIIIDAGQTDGGCNLSSLPLGGRVKVNNFFDADSFGEADEAMDQMIGSELLPGEAEGEVRCYVPSYTRCTQLQLRALPAPSQPTQEVKEIPRDDVEPFVLDQDFDYDSVVLTPKFTKAEMKATVDVPVTPSAAD